MRRKTKSAHQAGPDTLLDLEDLPGRHMGPFEIKAVLYSLLHLSMSWVGEWVLGPSPSTL